MYTRILILNQISSMTSPTPSRYTRMHSLLQQQFEPVFMDLLDESVNHRVPEGAESHFKLTLVSALFKGLSRMARHRSVNLLLMPEMKTGLHALSLALYTPEEWAAQPKPHSTPPCQHKSQSTSL